MGVGRRVKHARFFEDELQRRPLSERWNADRSEHWRYGIQRTRDSLMPLLVAEAAGNDFHPLETEVDFSRCTPVEGLVRSRSILSKTFLQSSPESLNDRDGTGASNSTETMVCPKAAKQSSETVGSKL
jgi:hypothetical protein